MCNTGCPVLIDILTKKQENIVSVGSESWQNCQHFRNTHYFINTCCMFSGQKPWFQRVVYFNLCSRRLRTVCINDECFSTNPGPTPTSLATTHYSFVHQSIENGLSTGTLIYNCGMTTHCRISPRRTCRATFSLRSRCSPYTEQKCGMTGAQFGKG
jgi:hypothetical protein